MNTAPNSSDSPARHLRCNWRELCLVLCLMALLAAIFQRAYTRNEAKNHAIGCLSNERQLAMAMLQYTADNNDAFPAGRNNFGGAGWCEGLAPYLGSHDVFHCPDDPRAPLRLADSAAGSPARYTVSYGLNSNLCERRRDPSNLVPSFWIHPVATLSSLNTPSATVMLFEVENAASPLDDHLTAASDRATAVCSPIGNLDNVPEDRFPIGCVPNTANGRHIFYATGNVDGRAVNAGAGPEARHNGLSSFVACDGHGYLFHPDQVSGGANAATSDSPPTPYPIPPPAAPGQISYRAAGTNVAGNMTFSTK